jgi:hypothetical protein
LGPCRAPAAATDNTLAQWLFPSRGGMASSRVAAQHSASAGLAVAPPRREFKVFKVFKPCGVALGRARARVPPAPRSSIARSLHSRGAYRWYGETPGLLANLTCIQALHDDVPRDWGERAEVREDAATSSAVTKLGLQSATCDPVGPTCGLTFELSRPWRQGPLADQSNMVLGVSAGLKLHDFSRSGHAGLLRPCSSIASS